MVNSLIDRVFKNSFISVSKPYSITSEEADLPFCWNCGKQLSEDDRFCPGCGKSTAGFDINRTLITKVYTAVSITLILASGVIAFYAADPLVKIATLIIGAATALITLSRIPVLWRSSESKKTQSLLRLLADVFDPRSFIVIVFVISFVMISGLIAYFKPTESTKFLDAIVMALISVVTTIVGFYFGQKTAEVSFEAAREPEISGFPIEFSGPTISPSVVEPGDEISGTGILKNRGARPIHIRSVCIAIRPPGAAPTGGPFRYDLGTDPPITLNPSESYTIKKSRDMPFDIPERYFEDEWYAFIACQRADGYWHDGPDKVSFKVIKKTPQATATP